LPFGADSGRRLHPVATDKSDRHDRHEKILSKLGATLRESPSSANFQATYDEVHAYVHQQCGYLYRGELSLFDKGIIRLIGRNQRVCDVGCGDGDFATACALKRNSVVALDISKVAARLANTRKGNAQVEFQVGDARSLPFRDRTFDVVVCKDILEHLPPEHAEMHFREVWRVLRENGRYFVFTPPKLLGDFSSGFHLALYGLTDLVPVLRKNGFRVEVISPVPFAVGLPCKTSFSASVAVLMLYERIIGRTGVGHCIGNCTKRLKGSSWILPALGLIVIPPPWFCAIKLAREEP
jgi:2-polyprenyl-3-methyl-5-hydroxy-6-metoxy-1,4-benzoquinol methylase